MLHLTSRIAPLSRSHPTAMPEAFLPSIKIEMNDSNPSRLFKCRVLVVEDDPLVLETTAAMVRSFGFSVRTAEDGFVALKILREVLPDMILCDLRMPGMSGFELLSIVRRRFP